MTPGERKTSEKPVPENRFSRHSKVRLLAHFVWSTEGRAPRLTEDVEEKVHTYISGVCHRMGCVVAAIGGTDDHVHLLVYLNHDVSASGFMNRVKGASSHFATASLGIEEFCWQRGYAVFGVSPRDKAMVSRYVLDQRERHAARQLWTAIEDLPVDRSRINKPNEP